MAVIISIFILRPLTWFASFSYLASLFCRVPANPSNPTFDSINLTETMTNLTVAWKSIRNDCSDLYLHNKAFKITMKPNWYLTSIFRRGLVNLSTLIYPNINLTKAIRKAAIISTSFFVFFFIFKQLHFWD